MANKTDRRTRYLAEWFLFLEQRGVTYPAEQDFTDFAKESKLKHLMHALSETMPDHAIVCRLAVKELTRAQLERKRKTSRISRRRAGRSSLPAQWQRLIDSWHSSADVGRMPRFSLDDDEPLSAASVALIKASLVSFLKSQADQASLDVTVAKIFKWIDKMQENGLKPITIVSRLNALCMFLQRADPDAERYAVLRKLIRKFKREAGLTEKEKEKFLRLNPITLADLWHRAELLFRQSRNMPAGSARRYRTALEALAIALVVVMPLRSADIVKLRIGREIQRSATGWSVATQIQKTGAYYQYSDLWPELTPFLDEVLDLSAAGRDLWEKYERRTGTPLFSYDGEAAHKTGWLSNIWYKNFGKGVHIIRTIWHEFARADEQDLTWMALAICGQKSKDTVGDYTLPNIQTKLIRKAKYLLKQARTVNLETPLDMAG